MLSRTIYARLQHVAPTDGDELACGAAVRILPPHVESGIDLYQQCDRLVVRAMCETCDSIELEQTFRWPHTFLRVLDEDELDEDSCCPCHHAYKCVHLGHAGECVAIDGESLCGSLPGDTVAKTRGSDE
jgi:hypothetical protein